MSSSGLIYLAILGAWAAYLASRCLRTPGHQTEAQPPADGAVLRRRGRGRRDRYAAYAEDEPVAEPLVKSRRADLGPRGGRPPAAVAEAAAARVPAPRPAVRVSRATARRRRRMLGLLTLAVLAVSVVAGLGLAAPWAPGVPVLVLLTYVVELRARTRRAQARLARVLRPVPLPIEAVAAGVCGPRRVLRVQPAADDDFVDLWPAFDDPVAAARTKGGNWEPVPVPLPTYVTAPKAPEVPAFGGRRIDVAPGRPWVASATEDTQEIPVVAVVLEKPDAGRPAAEVAESVPEKHAEAS